jgi:hypothetical protein
MPEIGRSKVWFHFGFNVLSITEVASRASPRVITRYCRASEWRVLSGWGWEAAYGIAGAILIFGCEISALNKACQLGLVRTGKIGQTYLEHLYSQDQIEALVVSLLLCLPLGTHGSTVALAVS